MNYRTSGPVAAALFLGGAWLGSYTAPGPRATAATPQPEAPPADGRPARLTTPARIGFVCMSEAVRRTKRWQADAATMNAAREKEAKRLADLQSKIEAKKTLAAKATGEEKQELDRAVIEDTRRFEDDERATRADLDGRSFGALKRIHQVFAKVVDDVAADRGLDVVYSCPARMERKPEGATEAQYLHAYFRSEAALPIYMKDQLDLTDEVALRVNRAFDAADRPPAKD